MRLRQTLTSPIIEPAQVSLSLARRAAAHATGHPGARVFFLSQMPQKKDHTRCPPGTVPGVYTQGRSIGQSSPKAPCRPGNDRSPFSLFRQAVPNAEPLLDGDWKDALWTLAQSNVLVGGPSTFFTLGAHLCGNCTVVVNYAAVSDYETKRTKVRFLAHSTEHLAARHHAVLHRNTSRRRL